MRIVKFKILLFCVFILCLVLGCKEENSTFYTCSNVLFTKSIKKSNCDSVNIIRYYENGQTMDRAYIIPPSQKLEGLSEEFYPDGFPKNKCMMSEGVNVTPKQMGKSSGYEVKIDFGPYETMQDGRRIRPFRTFVDGVSVYEYIVAIADTNGHDFLPQQLPRNMKRYKIVYGEDLQDTNEVEIDETMYPYYIEDMDLAKMVNTHGDTCFLVYFYYKSVFNHPYPNDERMVVMHDSLNWEVTEFIKHYR